MNVCFFWSLVTFLLFFFSHRVVHILKSFFQIILVAHLVFLALLKMLIYRFMKPAEGFACQDPDEYLLFLSSSYLHHESLINIL